jgi:hypothetical protein
VSQQSSPPHAKKRLIPALQGLLKPFGSYDRELANIPPTAKAHRLFKRELIEASLGREARRVRKILGNVQV